MTATNHTEHYDLSQYTDTDRPTYTGDYNSDMSKIDAAIYAASQSGGSGGLSAVSHDATLAGDGTGSTPLGIVNGLNFSSFNAELTWGRPLSEVKTPGLYRIVGNPQNSPDSDLPDFIKDRTQVTAVLFVYKNSTAFIRIICVEYAGTPSGGELTLRCFGKTYTPSASSEWVDLNPGGSAGGLTAVVHDATLTGDGTNGNPLGMIDGNFINAISKSGDDADANNLTQNRIYKINKNWKNIPSGVRIVGGSLFDASYGNPHIQCILAYTDGAGASIFIRQGWTGLTTATWERLVKESEYKALANRVATLEAQIAALTANATPSATGLTAEQLDS